MHVFAPQLSLFWLLSFSSTVMGRFPRLPDPNPPRPPNPINNPVHPPHPRPLFPEPVVPPKPADGPAQQNAIQTRMATLEKLAHLKEVGSAFGPELVKAIVGSDTSEQPTMTNLSPATLKPNTTLDMKLYTPCVSYAQKLDACASSVASFYTTTNSLAQVSCACYAPVSSGSCAKSTFETNFDDYATSCQQFMSSNGYTNVASAMNDSLLMPTPYFCQSMKESSRRNATTGGGLKVTLTPTACLSATTPQNTGGGPGPTEGRSTRHLSSDALRDALLVSISVCGFSWFFLL